jgi:hypothetical protein
LHAKTNRTDLRFLSRIIGKVDTTGVCRTIIDRSNAILKRGGHLQMSQKWIFVCLILLLACGCQETQVRQKANLLVTTLPDLYYEQVLDNLARASANPGTVPFFATPTQGTNQQTRQLQASYTPGLDVITNAANSAAGLIGHFVFDKQQAAIAPQIANAQTFQLLPLIDSDKLSLLEIAFRKALGDPTVTNRDVFRLGKFFSDHASVFSTDYYEAITGLPLPPADTFDAGLADDVNPDDAFPAYRLHWIHSEEKRRSVPKCACAVGQYCGVWIWVGPDDMAQFSRFTLAILNIASASGGSGSTKVEFNFGAGKVLHGEVGGQAVDLKVQDAPLPNGATPAPPPDKWSPPKPGGNQTLPSVPLEDPAKARTKEQLRAPTVRPTVPQFPFPAPP